MTKQDFEYANSHYFLPIVNDGAMYHQLLLALKSDNFAYFCELVDEYMLELKGKYKLDSFNLDEKVYVRLMVLDYAYEWSQINRLLQKSDYLQVNIKYCDSNSMGWLADQVFRRRADPHNTNNQPTEPTQEIPMSNKVEFKTVTYINNVDVTTLSDEQLIDAVKTIENEISDLGAVKTKSKKIEAKIAEAQTTLAKVVEVLDAR